MFPQQLAGERVQDADMRCIPLHLNTASDPARRRTVVSGLDLHATIQMYGALTVLVVAKRFQRQWQQRRALFGKHRRHLPFGGAVNARVGPTLFPAIQICLRFLQALEAQPLERSLLRMTDARLDFALGESHRMQVVWDPP